MSRIQCIGQIAIAARCLRCTQCSLLAVFKIATANPLKFLADSGPHRRCSTLFGCLPVHEISALSMLIDPSDDTEIFWPLQTCKNGPGIDSVGRNTLTAIMLS